MNEKIQVWYGNVSEQYSLLCRNKLVDCACTRFLCMHEILVHAQHSCACTTLLCMHWRGQGPRPGPNKKAAAPGPDPRLLFCWVPALVPGPYSACTRVLCMYTSVVHARESCACTRILCMHKKLEHAQESHNILFHSQIIMNTALKHFHTRDLIFSFVYTYIVD